MKKIMILMLSFAVLFSFAACDNSSNTPDTSEEEQGGTVSERYISEYATIIENMIKGVKLTGSEYYAVEAVDYATAKVGMDDIFTAENILLGADDAYAINAEDGYDANADYTQISRTVTIDTTMPGFSKDTVVTLTLNGIVTNPNAASSEDKTVQYETYTYAFETPVYDLSGKVVLLTGSIKGYVTGYGMTVKADGTAATVSAATPQFILPSTESAGDITSKVGDNTNLTSATLLSVLNTEDYTSAGIISYKGYVDGKIGNSTTGYTKDIADYVALLTGSSNSIFDLLVKADGININAATKPEGLAVEYDGSKTSGTATITWTIPESATAEAVVIAGDSSSGKYLELAPGDPLTITFNSKPNTDATDSFDVDTFTISGTFKAYSDADTAETKFAEIYDVTVNGKVTADDSKKITVADATAVLTVATPVMTIEKDSAATADIEVGPAIQKTGDNLGKFVEEAVTIEWPLPTA